MSTSNNNWNVRNEAHKRSKGKSLVRFKSVKSSHDNWQVETISGNDAIAAELNTIYCSHDFRTSAQKAWRSADNKDEREIQLNNGATVHKYPFTCCHLPKFVRNAEYLHQLRDELLSLEFNEKSNDLYKFHQSEDLKLVGVKAITALKELIYQNFRKWLIQVTGIELEETVDMSCAQYNHTDTLLCHDDELEGRRIAYILYLVDEDWNESDGGSLDLFSVDGNTQPQQIVKSLVPQWNSLAFFEVTPISFHQVAEVLTENKCRLSVSGWFHGKSVKRPKAYIEPIHLLKPLDMEEEDFYSWINPAYLEPNTQGDVQESFGEKSEIQLQEFFNPDKYKELCRALNSLKVNWTVLGPANKRHYEILIEDEADVAPIVEEARTFLQSEAFFLVLSNLTGLKLHKLAPTPSSSENESDTDDTDAPGAKDSKHLKSGQAVDPCCKLQVSRWQAGCYTLLHDQDADSSEYALDAWLFIGADNWQLSHGGQISYVAQGEDEELLTVCPSSNCLALVYRDKDTLRFVKHINSTSGDLKHFMLNAVYYDRPMKKS